MKIKTPKGTVTPPFDAWTEKLLESQRALRLSGEADVARHINERSWIWLYHEGLSPDEAAQVLLEDFEPPRPAHEIADEALARMPSAQRAPNMYREPTTPAHRRDAALFAGKQAVPVETPRADAKPGDLVAWPTAGQGRVVATFDAIDMARVAEVEIPGWYWTEGGEGYLTRTDTGTPATLYIAARDLTVKGEG